MRSVCLFIATLLISPLLCLAQSGRGGITGLITDQSGAVMPGVKLEITNTATGVRQETTSSSAGLYFFTALVPGTYHVSAGFAGFQKTVRESVQVETDRVTEVNLQMSPGEVTESVTVIGDPVLTNTTNSTIGQLITTKTLENMPMNGRNVYLLVQLTPGVVPINGSLHQTGAVQRPGVEVSAFRINGQQAGSVAYMLDGSPLTVMGYGAGATSPAFTPALDAVQEYRMENSNLQASVNSPGTGIISVVSKSGTDQFHGSGFYYARPNAMAANDPFNKASQARAGLENKPPDFHRYQFGGSIGGPIKRGKLFFFGDYERTETRTLGTATLTVPTAAEKQGDFSGIPTIWNPFDVNAAGLRQPFPGNVIPTSMHDPVALNIQKLIPDANQPGVGAYHSNNYFKAATFPNDSHKFNTRLDSYIGARHQVFGRYSFARMVTGIPDFYGNGADPNWYSSITHGQNVLLAHNFSMNPTTLLQLRASFTRHAEDQPPLAQVVQDNNMAKLGFPESLASQAVLQTIPRMNISGMTGVGSRTFSTGFKFITYNYDAIVSLDKVYGRHRMKMGFEYQKHFVNMGQPVAPSGQYNFDTTATSSRTRAGDGYGYAGFLLGMGQENTPTNSFTIDPFVAQSNPYYGLYFQDNVRLTSRLTIDFGLRWEVFVGRTERFDRQTYFDPDFAQTINGVSMRGALRFVEPGKSPFKTNMADLAPRFGVAYRITDRTVFHAGGGIFFGPSIQAVAIAGTNADGFSSRTRWNATELDEWGNTVMLNPLHDPFPNGLTPVTGNRLGTATLIGSNIATVLHSQPTQSAYNWNAGFQHELPDAWVISAAYVGSRGLHGLANYDMNQLPIETIAQYGPALNDTVSYAFAPAITDPTSIYYNRTTAPRWLTLTEYPQYLTGNPSGGVTINTAPLANSSYHSLQLRVEKRLTRALSMLASFTGGKILGTGTGPYAYIGQHANYQNSKNSKLDKAVDSQDVSRWFSLAAFYDLPVGRGRAVNTTGRLANAAFGGWTVNGGLFWSTGVPLQVSGSWPNRSTFFGQRPDLVCDPARDAPRTPERWFNPSCYAAPASPYVLGTAPRTLPNLRADGVHNIDFSLFKTFLLKEGMSAQFRVEVFNLLNSVQYGIPNTSWNPRDTSTFGMVTSASSSPRQLQFAVKFNF